VLATILLNYHIDRIVLGSMCVGVSVWLGWSSIRSAACNTETTPTQPHRILQHKSNQKQYDQCGNSTEDSQAPDDGYINVRNILST